MLYRTFIQTFKHKSQQLAVTVRNNDENIHNVDYSKWNLCEELITTFNNIVQQTAAKKRAYISQLINGKSFASVNKMYLILNHNKKK